MSEQDRPDPPPRRWDVIVSEDDSTASHFEVQWQAPALTVTLIARDLTFARRAIDFIAKTRDNPKFRDIPLGGGMYRAVVTELDLSDSFVDTSVCLGKDGMEDCRYYMRVRSGKVWLRPDIHSQDVERLVDTLWIIDEYCSDP